MRRLIKPEIQRRKRLLRSKIYRYNKNLEKRGISLDQQFNASLRGIRTAKDIERLEKGFARVRADEFVTTSHGLTLRQSEIKAFEKMKRAANKRVQQAYKDKKRRDEEIARKWGREPPQITAKEDEKPREYKRDVEDFQTYKQLVDFSARLEKAGTRGAKGQDLKDRILKALRGEVLQQANGYGFKGGKDNILADFIDKYLSPDEVEFFFGGHLNFEYCYSYQEGLLKEATIAVEIITDGTYPHLAEKWKDNGYSERWDEFMEEKLGEYAEEYGKFSAYDQIDKLMGMI